MSETIVLLITFLYMTSVFVESGLTRDQTLNNESTDEDMNLSDQLLKNSEHPDNNEGLTRETNVEIKQNYLECVNINSEVDKLTTNLNVKSNESCDTAYRFPYLQIIYEVSFKNGSSDKLEIKLDVQESELYPEKTIVTLTGKVVNGYLRGAHYQNVIVYPSINNQMVCSSESGITELQSTSASVTFILLPNIEEQNNSYSFRASHLPEAFDCFGSFTIHYTPGLLQLS